MREILFRGKRIDNGEWVCSGNLIHFNEENEHYIPDPNSKCLCRHDEADNIIEWRNTLFYKVIPETVGQYTGLTDKNGKKIFEGDIHEHNNERWYVRFGNFYDAELEDNFYGWHCVDNKGRAYGFNGTESLYMNIIGNIHDNPELLKGEENG